MGREWGWWCRAMPQICSPVLWTSFWRVIESTAFEARMRRSSKRLETEPENSATLVMSSPDSGYAATFWLDLPAHFGWTCPLYCHPSRGHDYPTVNTALHNCSFESMNLCFRCGFCSVCLDFRESLQLLQLVESIFFKYNPSYGRRKKGLAWS